MDAVDLAMRGRAVMNRPPSLDNAKAARVHEVDDRARRGDRGRYRRSWAKVEWGYGRILVRDVANAGWINYMLKDRQKSEFDGFVDCIIIESLHNPIADA
jgi:hypothetical protein